MTLFEPSLFVRRLRVLREAAVVAELTFHQGINVITGENAAGKSTLIAFLAYGLGSENIAFSKVAQLCTSTMVEVELNGAIVTLKRELTGGSLTGLSMFWGSMDMAAAAPWNAWQTYPFKRTEKTLSFSQVLFRALGLPELRGEAGENVTMHQVLRLIYSDQDTPGAELFRSERFDKSNKREAVGEYILGIDDNELYDLLLRAGSLEKEDAALGSALRAVYSALGQTNSNLSLDFLDARLADLGGELLDLRNKLDSNEFTYKKTNGQADKLDDQLRGELSTLHQSMSNLRDKKLQLIERLTDSELFIKELQSRSKNIEESIVAAKYLGAIKFSVCPCCLTAISERPENQNHCNLCNSEISESSARTQLARMGNEIALQLSESSTVSTGFKAELAKVDQELSAIEQAYKTTEERFKRSKASWRSGFEIARDSLLTRIGAIEQEIKQLADLRKLAQSLSAQQQKRADVAAELAKIREKIELARSSQISRKQEAYETVARHLEKILKRDEPRQPEFINPTHIDFEFGLNRVSINSEQKFAASSMVYLRHAFRMALLFAALEKNYFRHPRLVIIDGMEDGGMEPGRSFNFQNVVQEMSSEQVVQHQIVLTTSTIAPALDKPDYVVGRKYSHENRSLDIMM